MSVWSRLRSLLGLGNGAGAPADDGGTGGDAARSDEAAPGGVAVGEGRAPSEPHAADGEEEDAPLPGTLDDWDSSSQTGTITLADGATIRFGIEACREFQPLIGLRVDVLGTGVPPGLGGEAASGEAALWASGVRLRPGSESEYAARLRIYQVERAVRGEDGVVPGEPPWARSKVGKKPAGPGRPPDAFFALTVILDRELPLSPTAMSALLDGPVWRQPLVRLIPLLRRGKPEAGFSAEIVTGSQRAFLLYRPQPYTCGDGTARGTGHVGLFVGGPHGPRALASLPPQVAAGPPPLSESGEVRLVSELARALLTRESEAPGLVVNRAAKAWKPRETALSQLGEEDQRAPFLLWIDWGPGERNGHRVQRSIGMESLGLPDVAVRIAGDDELDRARDAVWWICQLLTEGRLAHPPEPAGADGPPPIAVPRRVRLLPGSRLVAEDAADVVHYRVLSWDAEWLELQAAS